MTTPIEAIADALLAFILTLLRDPDAAAEFASNPAGGLADHNLETACMRDLAAVRPVIVDRPDVVMRTQTVPVAPPADGDTEVTREIIRMVQQFSTTTIDARSTIVDNSVNQSIWTGGGDVTQVFDQEAIIASGDGSVAAGNDGTIVDSDVDVTIGDIAIGNETTEGSFNGTGSVPVDPAAPTAPPETPVDPPAPVLPADVAEPADVLEADMTADADASSYDADAASAAAAEQPVVDEPIEEE